VWVEAGHWTGEELPQVEAAAGDVAADVVRVVCLKLGRGRLRERQDSLPEARGKPLDLTEDRLGHLRGGAVRDVAVRPDGVLARRRAGGVEQAVLREQHERPGMDLAACCGGLRRLDLLESPAQVDP